MTKQEAIQAMKEGKKVTHIHFLKSEWVKSDPTGSFYEFEDGVKCDSNFFWMDRKQESWNEDWSLYNSRN